MILKRKALSVFISTASLTLIRFLRGLGNLIVYPFIVASFGYELLGIFIVWYSVASGVGRLLTLGSSQAGFRDIGLVQNQEKLSKLYSLRLILSLIVVISAGIFITLLDSIPSYLIFLLPVILLGLADGPEWVANNKGQVEKLAIIKSVCFILFVGIKIWVLLNLADIVWFYFIVSLEAVIFLIIPYFFFPMKIQMFSKNEITLILKLRRNLVYDNFFQMLKPRLDTWLVSFLYGPAIAGSYGFARQILYSILIPAVAFTSITLRTSDNLSNHHFTKDYIPKGMKTMIPYWIYGVGMTIIIALSSLIASLIFVDVNIPFYWVAVGSFIILPMAITAGILRSCLIKEYYDLILQNNILFCLLLLSGSMGFWWLNPIKDFIELQIFAPLILTAFITAYIFFIKFYSKQNLKEGGSFGY